MATFSSRVAIAQSILSWAQRLLFARRPEALGRYRAVIVCAVKTRLARRAGLTRDGLLIGV